MSRVKTGFFRFFGLDAFSAIIGFKDVVWVGPLFLKKVVFLAGHAVRVNDLSKKPEKNGKVAHFAKNGIESSIKV